MATVTALASRYDTDERPAGNLLDLPQITAQLLAAVRMYAGYGTLEAHLSADPAPVDVDAGIDISISEWAVIRPLFLLYLERENAIQLEASRGFGVDPYGRPSESVAADIAAAEAALPLKAFCQLVQTI